MSLLGLFPSFVTRWRALGLARGLLALFFATGLGAQSFTGDVAVTGSGTSNLYAALAHNSSGEIYAFWKLAATSSGMHHLMKWNGTSWTELSSFTAAQMLTGSQGTQDDVAFAIDGNGAFHVVSRVYGPGADLAAAPRVIMYGYSANGTTWTFTQIHATPANNSSYNTRYPAIAVDGNNRPHILFRSDNPTPTGYGLRYHSFNGTAWSGSEIYITPSRSQEINSLSFGLDSNGGAHIVFVAESATSTDGSPYYMTNASGSWSSATKLFNGASTPLVPNVAVAIDASNKVHFVYQDQARSLHYYNNVSGSFAGAQINGSLTGAITRDSFAINASGHMFLAYNSGTSASGIASYAFRLNGQGSWTTGTAHSNTGDTANTATTALPVDLTDGNVAMLLLNTLTNPRYLRWSQATIASANTAPTFVGSTTTLTVAQDSAATNIKALLHASDADASQTLTWSVTAAPAHGSLSSFSGATASSGSTDITPGGTLTYTPTSGYSGSDSFTVQVSDGSATASRTISVTVTDSVPPTIISIARQTPAGQAIGGSTTSVTFRVTYSEAVQNVGSAQFELEPLNGSTIAGSVTNVTGSGTTRDVTVSISSGTGEFRLKPVN